MTSTRQRPSSPIHTRLRYRGMALFFLESSLDGHEGLPGPLAMFGTQFVPAETSDLEQARQRAHIRIGQPRNLQGRPHEFQDGLPGRAADVGGGEDSLEAVVASDDG